MKQIERNLSVSSKSKANTRASFIAQKTCAFQLNWLPLEHDSLYDPSFADLKPSECGYIKKSDSIISYR